MRHYQFLLTIIACLAVLERVLLASVIPQRLQTAALTAINHSLNDYFHSKPHPFQLIETSMIDNQTVLVFGVTTSDENGVVRISFETTIMGEKRAEAAHVLFTSVLPRDLRVHLVSRRSRFETQIIENRVDLPPNIVELLRDEPLEITVFSSDNNWLRHIKAALIVQLSTRNRRSSPAESNESDCLPATSCCLRRKLVSFRDIGWDRWIIAPSGFYTGVCEGTCSPLGGDLNSEMGDSVGSINHNLFSPPVCRPSEFASLKIIYRDVVGNIWMANVQDLMVTGCQCVLEAIEATAMANQATSSSSIETSETQPSLN